VTPVYQIADRKDSRALTEYLAQNGQLLRPMVKLIESPQAAVEDFTDVLGRAAPEAVLQLAAQQVAEPRPQGRPGDDVRRHGAQGGVASLRERLEELFTINRLGFLPTLRCRLATNNIVENPSAGVRIGTRRVTWWEDGAKVLRWAAGAFLATEASFRRIDGYRDLWTLNTVLNEGEVGSEGGNDGVEQESGERGRIVH